jgi:predicted DsbA family dithiol-disulfide isomerase
LHGVADHDVVVQVQVAPLLEEAVLGVVVDLGVTGVPFAVFGGRAAIPGAASSEAYAKVIEQAWGRS